MADVQQVAVDIEQLRIACTVIQFDLELSLKPGIPKAEQRFQQGLRFGRSSPSGEVDAARTALAAALRRHRENNETHLRRMDRLVHLLKAIATSYAEADSLTQEKLQRIQKDVEKATNSVTADPKWGLIP